MTGHFWTDPVFDVFDQVGLNQAATATETSWIPAEEIRCIFDANKVIILLISS